MKIQSFILVFVIINSSVLAQDIKSGIITYKLEKTTESLIDTKVDPIFELIENSRKNLFFNLKFKGHESVFLLEEFLSFDLEPIKAMVARSMISGDYYSNIAKDSLIRKTNLGGKDYLVYSKLSKINWELLDETKIIDGFVCYKAVAYKEIIRDSNIKKVSITAWYCPQIPFPFGPKEFNNLPGLILELHDQSNNSFYAEKLQLFVNDQSSLKLDKIKGTYISEKEHDEIISKLTLKFKDDYTKNE